MRNVIFSLCIMGLSASCSQPELPKTGLEGQEMPSFSVLAKDSSTYLNTRDIPSGKSTVLLLFGPYCPYSRAEVENITKNMKSMKDVNFYLFTSSPYNEMIDFSKSFKLDQYSNVTIGVDTGFFLIKYFKITGVPFTAIYTKDKKLKQTFGGNIEAAVIKDFTGS